MMNKKVLTMAVMAAVCGMAAAPVWAANSGGTVNGDGKFVGNNGAADNRLLIDEDLSQESISGLVDKIVDSQVQEGFFKDCPITFHDITVAKDVFKEKLKTIYHTRISYPELKKK